MDEQHSDQDSSAAAMRYMMNLSSERAEAGGWSLPRRTEDKTEDRSAIRTKLAGATSHRFAFAGLLVFTALLYLRPHEMFPDFFGTFPLIKIVASIALLSYFLAKVVRSEAVSIFPLELKMLLLLMLIGLFTAPLAAAPGESMDVIFDLFVKVVAIFVLMINVITTRKRLLSMFSLVVICGTILAALAIHSYVTGDFKMIVRNGGFVVGMRIFGSVGGIVGNPNDLAICLDMIMPLAVLMGLLRRGVMRMFYFACAVVMLGGVVVTFSRAGFLGVITLGFVLLWKVGRQNRAMTALFFVAMAGMFAMAVPNGYGGRISSILHIGEDPTGSSEARRDLLERVISVAAHHPLVGVGMGNFHIYSIHEQVSHNAYLETAAELGVFGLMAYLVLIFSPLRSLRKIEREIPKPESKFREDPESARHRELRLTTLALEAVLFAYIVCSFFGSIEYQWFLYYPVAYVIAFRGIYYNGRPARSTNREADASRGVLWKRYKRIGPLGVPAAASAEGER